MIQLKTYSLKYQERFGKYCRWVAMIIEFIGSSSSGKSTIVNGVKTSMVQKYHNFSFLSVGGNYLYDLIALPWFMKFALRNKAICKLAKLSISKHTDNAWNYLNLYRNFIKKMGIYEFVRARRMNENIIWDEGSVHAAHNLFVHVNTHPCFSGVEEFARLVPLPDVIIYVKASVGDILFRMSKRGWHRRVNNNESDMRLFVEHALLVFERLIAVERIKKRTVIVNNGESNKIAINEVLEAIELHLAASQ